MRARVVAKDGGAIETATIGREGAVGLHAELGKRLNELDLSPFLWPPYHVRQNGDVPKV